MTPPSKESEASGTDRLSSHGLLRERTIAELQQLHENVEELSRVTGVWSGVGARRRLRDAKNAETDLLRVLGFSTYGEFLALIGPPGMVSLVEPETGPTSGPARPDPSERERARTRELERALGSAHAEIEELRTKLAQNPAGAPAPAPSPAPVEADSVRVLREGVENAAQELAALSEATQDLREMIVEIGAELIAARLEILVAQRRLQAPRATGPQDPR